MTQTPTVQAPTGVHTFVPLMDFLEEDHFQREIERVFRRAWLPVINVSDLPKPNSYLVLDMPTFKTSFLITRGEDNEVGVFHNMCRHRGNKLVRQGQGCARRFSCGFHGWTYGNDGRLQSITDHQQFGDLDAGTLGLIRVNSQVWEGLLFVNLEEQPHESLSGWMGKLYEGYNGYFDDLEKVASWQMTVNCNWHIAVNAFTEGYHTAFIHRETVPDYQGGKNNPMRHRPGMEFLRRHSRYSVAGNPEHKVTPVEELAYSFGHKYFPEFRVDTSHLPPAINPWKVQNWGFDIVHHFPCYILMAGARWAYSYWFWPIDKGRTLLRLDVFASKAKNAGERLGQAYYAARSRDVYREDLNTLEAIQSAFQSGAMREIVLSKQESALKHHYDMLKDMLHS
jgi:glycine betaine catabolism A